MNYWLLTSEYPPEFGGGISTYCLHTANMLQENNYSVSIFVRDFTVNEVQEKQENSRLRIIRFNPNISTKQYDLGYDAALSYAYAHIVKIYLEKEGLPDILESQEYAGIAYYILQFKYLQYPLFKDLYVLITLHAPGFLYFEYNKVPLYQFPYYWTGEMEKFCIRAADLLISPSAYLVKELKQRMFLEDETIHVLPNPYKNKQQAIAKAGNKLVFFGKLIPQKGCLELIDYFSHLWKKGFKEELYLIGGGDHLYHPEQMDMNAYIRKKYNQHIHSGKLRLLGAIPPQQLQSILNDAKVIFIPSIVDNLPYTVLESMCEAKVVMASVQGGQSELITQRSTGYLFDHEEAGSFERVLQEILTTPAQELEQVAQAGAKTIHQKTNYSTIFQKKSALIHQSKLHSTLPTRFPLIKPTAEPDLSLPSNTSTVTSLLSVVIPYYNMHPYVEDCLKSLVKSDYPQLEIIIINDGSDAPGSEELLKNLALKYPVQVHHQQNKGLAETRNAGARIARGEFLSFLDADDKVEATYYRKAILALNAYTNLCFVGCWANYFEQSDKIWPAFSPEAPYLLVHNPINSSALVYKKSAFLKYGLNDKKMIYGMEDYESVIALVKEGCTGAVLPEALWYYRIRSNSMARAFTPDKQLFLYRLISEKHSTFYANFAVEIFNILNANGPGIYFDNPTLFYKQPGKSLINNKIRQQLVNYIKQKPALRKLALKLKKYL